MLDEYMKSFQKRNPNLYVFNATLHNDEATPHLHINFIPFYTSGREKGLCKGVSFKAALIEQGFIPSNAMKNQTVAWEENERNVMEQILNSHGYNRENKNDKHVHMNVTDYKIYKEEEKIQKSLNQIKRASAEESNENNIIRLKEKLIQAEHMNRKLSEIHKSQYVPCYYSSPDKLAFVQSALDKEKIQYHETDTGFEIKKCFIEKVREIEKSYKPVRSTLRDKLREDIDRLVLASDSVEDLLRRLEAEKYRIKHGKYISVCPEQSEKYIRLKSLGESYSELALRNRIASAKDTEAKYTAKLNALSDSDSFERTCVQSICVYFVGIKRGIVPMRKRNAKQPFSWKNDVELDKLSALNAKINEGASLDSLKKDFEINEEKVNNLRKEISEQKALLSYFTNLKEKIKIVFEGQPADQDTFLTAKREIERFTKFSITKDNYRNIYSLITSKESMINRLESELSEKTEELKISADYYTFAQKIAGGTYVQELAYNENIMKLSDYVETGSAIIK